MAFTTLKTKQSLEHLRPKPQARTEESYKKMERSTTNNVCRLTNYMEATINVLVNWIGVISKYNCHFQFFGVNSLEEVR